jgi:phenylalanyl-tRNA synthetase beta subunit
VHLSFQAPDRTLTDDEAAALRERIVTALTERFGAELRG